MRFYEFLKLIPADTHIEINCFKCGTEFGY